MTSLRQPSPNHDHWLALSIGNSRLHWAWFVDGTIQQRWHIPHSTAGAITPATLAYPHQQALPPSLLKLIEAQPPLEIWIASVVPHQTALWCTTPHHHLLELSHLPLQGLYPTLGIDRALAVVGAQQRWPAAVLVIDCGTALTLTGATASGSLIGGAILPGLTLQFNSLAHNTAALPRLQPDALPGLPDRWARNTSDAMVSGVFYSILASLQSYITDWQHQFPDCAIAFTGGDGAILRHYLQQVAPELRDELHLEPDLAFHGIAAIRAHHRPT